ncbi:hypothetical protein ZIOFF_014628 [Zingiber officinale]|uniref:Metallo-beta-lactamase domain-containing protein n=1 Tax=Zingiber officinale TaxID=94328 RepID=A0A8J5HD93_ZINOF|nr:hypothetical protein ZIOFF_014628 [Zingiber officinale]
MAATLSFVRSAACYLVSLSTPRWGSAAAESPRYFLHLPSRPRLLPRRIYSKIADAETKVQAHKGQSEIIFLGTGTSEGIPRVSCLTAESKICEVCSKASVPGDKNNRLNTSILICYVNSLGRYNILVDAGKYESNTTSFISNTKMHIFTFSKHISLCFELNCDGNCRVFFYHSALQWFPTYGILQCSWLRKIDAVIITHSHADAIGGLDDLRDWTNNVQPSVPIYVAQRDFEVMKKTHYYIVDTSGLIPGAAVSKLHFNVIKEEPFVIHDLKVTPLPVWHGKGYRSLGFRFGNICYISDVSDIPEETYMLLKDCDLLILDALRPDRSSSTHFGLPRALDEVRKIQPRRTLFTGMMHLMDHEKINEQLAKLQDSEGLNVQLSYDGLRIPVNL